jgi:hypothetical protein
MTSGGTGIGIIACGALARDLVALKKQNHCTHWHVYCLPPELHNQPARIVPEVAAKLDELRGRHTELFVAYADCGTAGALDSLLAPLGVSRLPGAHCYETFAGRAIEEALEEEPGTFFLTDFLVRHFDRLVVRGLGLDRCPELRHTFFANYRRVVYLAQTNSAPLEAQARRCAGMLGLEYHHRSTGRERLRAALAVAHSSQAVA